MMMIESEYVRTCVACVCVYYIAETKRSSNSNSSSNTAANTHQYKCNAITSIHNRMPYGQSKFGCWYSMRMCQSELLLLLTPTKRIEIQANRVVVAFEVIYSSCTSVNNGFSLLRVCVCAFFFFSFMVVVHRCRCSDRKYTQRALLLRYMDYNM